MQGAAPQETRSATQRQPEGGWRWVYLLVALLLLLGAAVNLLPVAIERVNQFIAGTVHVAGVAVQALQTTAENAYAPARHGVEISPEVTAALGKPLEFAPVEQLQWGEPTGDSLTFSFTVSGPNGQATAQATVRPGTDEFELISLEVRTGDSTLLDLRKL